MDWRVKGMLQGALSRIPGGALANDALQRLAGGRRDLAAHVAEKVRDDFVVHARHLRELRFDVRDRVMLEIGTGWLPVMPLCFALTGVRRCLTFDLERHLRPRGVLLALGHLEPLLPEIADAAGIEPEAVRERWRAWRALPDDTSVLAAAGVEYRAPADATATSLPAASVGIVFSNSVLEHVPAAVLDGLMREAHRVLEPGGLALHCVNCGDHYAYFDRRITPIHYLRFTEREWRRWNNRLLYQNRLRPSDFVAAARGAGLEIVMERFRPRPELLAALKDLPLAPEFRRYPAEQLCSTSIDLAARRP